MASDGAVPARSTPCDGDDPVTNYLGESNMQWKNDSERIDNGFPTIMPSPTYISPPRTPRAEPVQHRAWPWVILWVVLTLGTFTWLLGSQSWQQEQRLDNAGVVALAIVGFCWGSLIAWVGDRFYAKRDRKAAK